MSCRDCYDLAPTNGASGVYTVERLIGQNTWYDPFGNEVTDAALLSEVKVLANAALPVDCNKCCPSIIERPTCVLLNDGSTTRAFKRIEINPETLEETRHIFVGQPPDNENITDQVDLEFPCTTEASELNIAKPEPDDVGTLVAGSSTNINVAANDKLCPEGVTTFVPITGTFDNIGSVSPASSSDGVFSVTPNGKGSFSFEYEIYCDGSPSGQRALVTGEAICPDAQTGNWSQTALNTYRDDSTGITVELVEQGSASFNASSTILNTFNNQSFWSENLAGDIELDVNFTWDVFADFPASDIDTPTDDKSPGIIRITFPSPVDNPVLHLDRVGAYGRYTNIFAFPPTQTLSNSARWTLTTPGLSLTRLEGTQDFDVTTTTIQKTPDEQMSNTATSESTLTAQDGTAAGSVQINGTGIAQVEFRLEGVGVEGSGQDGFGLIVTGAIC